jgi:hypothetical protein
MLHGELKPQERGMYAEAPIVTIDDINTEMGLHDTSSMSSIQAKRVMKCKMVTIQPPSTAPKKKKKKKKKKKQSISAIST